MNTMWLNAFIATVLQGSPAERAGVKVGDVIIKFGRRTVTDFESLSKLVHERVPGDVVVIEIQRGNRQIPIEVTLGKREVRPR